MHRHSHHLLIVLVVLLLTMLFLAKACTTAPPRYGAPPFETTTGVPLAQAVRPSELDRSSLGAERGVWYATNTIAKTGIFQLFASALAAWLLWETLKATRIATQAATRASDAAVSASAAHVFVDVTFESEVDPNDPGRVQIRPRAQLVNYGQTPALDVVVRVTFDPYLADEEGGPWHAPQVARDNLSEADRKAVLAPTGSGEKLFINPQRDPMRSVRPLNERLYAVWTLVEYRTVFDPDRTIVRRVRHTAYPLGNNDFDQLTVEGELDLVLRLTNPDFRLATTIESVGEDGRVLPTQSS